MVADNDLAVGRLVEAVSNSPIWKETAVFVIEDDSQDGPDHVSAQRSVAFVASPYVKRGSVDHTFYTTCGILRTMELLMGLPPMNQNDATATPMAAFWSDTPDLTPFTAEQPKQKLDEINGVAAYGAQESKKMAFEHEDRAPWRRLNEILWHSIKGPNVPMPAPRRMRHPLIMALR